MSMLSRTEAMIRQQGQTPLPQHFLSQLDIQEYWIRVAAMVNGNTLRSLQGSLLELLERDLDVLGAKLPHPLLPTVHVDFLAAKLRLYALPLLSARPSPAKPPDALCKALWYKGFHIAVQISNIFAVSAEKGRSLSSPADRALPHEGITIYYPKHYFRVLVMAGMYLLILLATDRDMSPQDKVLARNRVKEVYEALIHWSSHDRDEFMHTAKVIELLSRHVEDDDLLDGNGNAELDAVDSTSSSIIHNGVKLAQRLRRRYTAFAANRQQAEPEQQQHHHQQQHQQRSSEPEPHAASATAAAGGAAGEIQDEAGFFLGGPLSPGWEAWLSDSEDFMALLQPEMQMGHVL